MQSFDQNNVPVTPIEELDLEKVRDLLEDERVDHVKVAKKENLERKFHPSVGSTFGLGGLQCEITKVLKGNRMIVKYRRT